LWVSLFSIYLESARNRLRLFTLSGRLFFPEWRSRGIDLHKRKVFLRVLSSPNARDWRIMDVRCRAVYVRTTFVTKQLAFFSSFHLMRRHAWTFLNSENLHKENYHFITNTNKLSQNKISTLCKIQHWEPHKNKRNIYGNYTLEKSLVALIEILVKNGQIRIFWLSLL